MPMILVSIISISLTLKFCQLMHDIIHHFKFLSRRSCIGNVSYFSLISSSWFLNECTHFAHALAMQVNVLSLACCINLFRRSTCFHIFKSLGHPDNFTRKLSFQVNVLWLRCCIKLSRRSPCLCKCSRV